MLRILNLIIFAVVIVGCNSTKEKNVDLETMAFISKQLENTLKVENNPSKIPRTTDADGNLITVGTYNWTSGFFAGNLWYMYELTKEDKWKKEAIKRTEVLEEFQNIVEHHDIGFIMFPSYGNGLLIGDKEEYKAKAVIIATGATPRKMGCPGEVELTGKGV